MKTLAEANPSTKARTPYCVAPRHVGGVTSIMSAKKLVQKSEHVVICPTCGADVDLRNLADVLATRYRTARSRHPRGAVQSRLRGRERSARASDPPRSSSPRGGYVETMECKHRAWIGRYRILHATGPVEHYCNCSAGDVRRTRDEATNSLLPNAPKPIAKAKLRARKRPKKATPRVAAKAPTRKKSRRS